jgi:hypothetical protein
VFGVQLRATVTSVSGPEELPPAELLVLPALAEDDDPQAAAASAVAERAAVSRPRRVSEEDLFIMVSVTSVGSS